MSFEHIQLPTFLIADIYKDYLIETIDIIESEPKTVAENAIKSLGENKKNISIIVNDNSSIFLSDTQFEFLSKMLGACKLSVADVSIVNISNKQIDYNQIKEQFNCSFLILFGIDARAFKLPLIFPEYRIQHFNNCQMLIAKNLEVYTKTSDDAQVEKRKLWESLKLLFAI